MKRPATIMCDANSSEMVNGLPVKEESEVSLIEDRSGEVKETGNGDALFETKEVEDVTIKEEYPYDEEHMVIVDPLLTFQCKHCKKVFTTQCDLDFHMKEKHTEAKLLSCTMCSETFLEESDLMMHAKFHNHGNPCIIKSSPLLPDQLLQLVLLIKEREGILFGNKRGPILSARKTHTWAEIATLFNAKNLGQGALSVQQIKEAWEYICKRVREAEAAHLKQHGAAGDVPLMSTFTAPYMQLASHILTRECISGNQAPEECQSQDEPSANTPRTSSSPPRPKYRKILPNVPPPLETQDSESSFGENDHSESEEENSTGSLDPGRSSQPEQAEANAKPKDGNGTAVVSSMKDLLGSVSSTVGHQVLFICGSCGLLHQTVEEVNACDGNSSVAEQNTEMIKNAGRGRPIWQKHQVEALLLLMKENFPRLIGNSLSKTKVYSEITATLQEVFQGVTRKQVEKKWRSMKYGYRTYQRTKLRGARALLPKHFNLLRSILGDTLPASMQPQDKSSGGPTTNPSGNHQVPLTSEKEAVQQLQTPQEPKEAQTNEVSCAAAEEGQLSRTRTIDTQTELLPDSLTESVNILVDKLDHFMEKTAKQNEEILMLLKSREEREARNDALREEYRKQKLEILKARHDRGTDI